MSDSEFNYQYSPSPNGISANAEIKRKLLAAALSAGVNVDLMQDDYGIGGNASPYVSADIGPLNLNLQKDLGGYRDNQGEFYGSSGTSYGAGLDIGRGSLGVSAQTTPYGLGYGGSGSMPLGGGSLDGYVNTFQPKEGDRDLNARIQYSRKF